ncbi:putative aldouronate transport system permease protein [Anaerocolumna jejuensis DSM 15929]|uniref:Putative aldouronate transport system permease protein n=1 Tax=Anaerocolumna jejuensis DSM 15929 TaxID=1121322 RepID=A0A1M6YRI1_9FIRM|nr:carbohydrate ABC transporter permease [Anaerocolumna jejuensis]SHL20886.1 putative aldouronate transport system permease protein [Anaerocolumna jejuensis DSM 15929]
MDNRSFSSKVRNIIIYAVVFLLGVMCLLPLWNIVAISFSSGAAVSANKVGLLPIDFTLAAYKKIIGDNQFWRSFGISVIRVFFGVLLNVSLCVLMAYPLTKTKREFKARNIYMNLLIFAMLFNGGMIPSFILVKNLGLLNSIWALILPGALPIFNVILVMNFFLGIPKSLEEAAVIDGSTPIQVLTKILVPCAKPSIATIALFSIVGNWNDFFAGLIYIQKVKNYPIMTYIQSLRVDMQELLRQSTSSAALGNAAELSNKNLNAAKIMVAIIPLLLIYPFLQKYLITGMVMGSVKE